MVYYPGVLVLDIVRVLGIGRERCVKRALCRLV